MFAGRNPRNHREATKRARLLQRAWSCHLVHAEKTESKPAQAARSSARRVPEGHQAPGRGGVTFL